MLLRNLNRRLEKEKKPVSAVHKSNGRNFQLMNL